MSFPPPGPRPFDAPRPVVPLGYTHLAVYQGRPNGLMALGIIGLLLAALSLGTNVLSLANIPKLRGLSKAVSGSRANHGPAVARVTPYTGDLFAAQGWPRDQRLAFIHALQDSSFSPDREVMLERLLGEFGQMIQPASGQATTAPTIDHLPAGPDGLHELGSTVIHVQNGVIWLDDASAYFQDNHGHRYQIHQDQVIDPTGATAVSSVAVAEELDSLHAVVGSSLNSTQAATLASVLLQDAPQYQAPLKYGRAHEPPADTPLDQPRMVGNTFAYGSNHTHFILPNGGKTDSLDNFDANTGAYTPSTPAAFVLYTPSMLDGMQIDGAACLVLALFEIGACVLLLLAAKQAASWSVRFAWAKLVQVLFWLAFTVAIVLPRVASQPNAPVGFGAGVYVGGVVIILCQLAYPIALLIAMRTSAMRGYFGEAGVHVLPPRLRLKFGPIVRGWMTSPAGRILSSVAALFAVWFCITQVRASNGPAAADTPHLFESAEAHAITAILCGFTALLCMLNWVVSKPEILVLEAND